MREILEHLFSHHTLSREEACHVLKQMAAQQYNGSQMAAFLAVFRMRSITVDELEGFRDAMLELCRTLDFSAYDSIDLCGTGGDGKDTFNISTLSAFVVAGSGVRVTKHGNNGVSSICGSSNVLQHLGVQFTNDESLLRRQIEEAGICYLHAPLFHPAMKHIAPVRRELRTRTFFNMLGPLVNPASPKSQLIGVFSLELARLYGYLLQRKTIQYKVVHTLDGYDEVSLTGPFKMVSRAGEELLRPSDLGLQAVRAEEIHGGDDIASAAAIFMRILEGQGTEAQTRVVIANAGLAIHCARPHLSFSDAFAAARESLDSGKAKQALLSLISISSH